MFEPKIIEKLQGHLDSKVDNRAAYTAIGINMEGQKSVLGLWVSGNEGAKHWMPVLQNLKTRGMKDAFMICTDGLKGCIVHLIRASLNFVNGKERKAMAADLKPIYRRRPLTWQSWRWPRFVPSIQSTKWLPGCGKETGDRTPLFTFEPPRARLVKRFP